MQVATYSQALRAHAHRLWQSKIRVVGICGVPMPSWNQTTSFSNYGTFLGRGFNSTSRLLSTVAISDEEVMAAANNSSVSGLSMPLAQQQDVHMSEAVHVPPQPEQLFEAAEKGDLSLFEELSEQQLRKGLSLRNEDGRSLLHVAAAAGHSRVVSLLSDGVDASESGLDSSDDEGWTPLHSAASSGHTAVVDALLEAGADIQIANAGGRTALHYAASKGHSDIARALIARGAKINKKDKMGCTPLHRAASAGHMEVADVLIEEGADVEATDNEGQTPLMLATICENRQVALLLLRHGADIDAEDKEGFTVLGRASEELRSVLIDAAKAMIEV